MDLPSGADAPPERSLPTRRPETTLDDLDARLAVVERRLERVAADLAAVADSLESTVGTAVATEMGAAAGDLRHTVSELGRILVRDLGKLPQMLTQHRQEIVAEIRAASPPQPGPSVVPAAVAGPEAPDPEPGSVVDPTGHGPAEPAPELTLAESQPGHVSAAPVGGEEGAAGRGWRARRRHQD